MGLSRTQKITLLILVVGTFITMLNQTAVTPVVPSVMAEMGITAATAQWLTTGFTLVNAIMIPITAFFIDRFPIKNLFIFSMAFFAIGSALAGWAPSFPVMLAGRLVQAMGAGVLMPMVMTVLMMYFPVEKRGRAMGLFGLVGAVAPAIGPTAAGLIIDHASWHIMFLAIAVLSTCLTVVGAITLQKEAPAGKAHASFDLLSVILSCLGLGGLLYGFSSLGSSGITVVDSIVSAVGLVAIILFVRRQFQLEQPMLQIRIMKNRTFLVGTVIGMIVQAALLSTVILIPIYVQNICGQSATASGLILLPGATLMGVMGPVAGRLFDKYGPRALCLTGTALLTLSTLSFAFLTSEINMVFLTVMYTIRMFSLSLINMPITTWGMNALETKVLNHGTSINNTLRQISGSLGTALIMSLNAFAVNMALSSTDEVQASMIGMDVAFAACAALCAFSFIMVAAMVKTSPKATQDADPSNARRSVIESIMKTDVYFIPESATIAQAMQLFLDRGISAAPIVNNKGLAIGFISDGDIMRCLSKRETAYMDPIIMIGHNEVDDTDFDEKLNKLMNMSVKEIGNLGTIGVDVHSDLGEVCRVLGENHLKKVPVLNNGRIVGIINRSDITKYGMRTYLERQALQMGQ